MAMLIDEQERHADAVWDGDYFVFGDEKFATAEPDDKSPTVINPPIATVDLVAIRF